MNGSTIIFGVAGVMLLIVSLYELITDKALINTFVKRDSGACSSLPAPCSLP